MQTTSIQYQCLQHQPNTNAHNINPKSMHIATDFLLDGLLGAENFHPSQYASDLSFCAEPKAKSQNPSSQKIILALRERGDRRRRRWVRARKNHFLPPLIRLAGIFSRGRKFSFAYWNSGFCNSGQALRAEWHVGEVRDWEKTSSLKCAAPNGTKWTALVLSQRNESLKNQFTWRQSKADT